MLARPTRAIALAVLILEPPLICRHGAAAQEAQKYLLPPKAIVDAFDAEPLPQTLINPNHQAVALTKARTYPTIAELAQPMLRLAGVRGTAVLSITMKRCAAGAETNVTMPPQARVSHVKFSADGSRLAFLNTKIDTIEPWVREPRPARGRGR